MASCIQCFSVCCSASINLAAHSRPLLSTLLSHATTSSTSAFAALHRSVSANLPTTDSRTCACTTPVCARSLPPTAHFSSLIASFLGDANFAQPSRQSQATTHSEDASHACQCLACTFSLADDAVEGSTSSNSSISLSGSMLDILPDFGIFFAVPKNKPSKQRGKTRRVGKMLNRGIPLRRYRTCPNCNQPMLNTHICYNCFLNNKQLTRVTGWRNKSVFPWKDKVKTESPEQDTREWTAPQGVPDNRSWLATQVEKLYLRERAAETKRKKKHPSDMRREKIRLRNQDERERRYRDVNKRLKDEIREADVERAKQRAEARAFAAEWNQKHREKIAQLDVEYKQREEEEKARQ